MLKAVYLISVGLLLVGCASIPQMDSSELMKRMTAAYSHCRSLKDSGTIRDVNIEGGETDLSNVRYSIEFVRDVGFRLELHSQREYGVGPYSLVYHWDGSNWCAFSSIDQHYGADHVITNADEASVCGSGIALSYGLFPFTAKLLCLNDEFCGFHGLDEGEMSVGGIRASKRAEASIGRIGLRRVYRLSLIRHHPIYHDVDEYWIDPQTYLILKQRASYVKQPGGNFGINKRTVAHSPRLNALSANTTIQFNPPPLGH